ncbi:MAG: DUF6316 family protein [Marinobacter sp.]|nr:DUF6316 family protein [Marinobacter sp.]
MAKFFSFTSKSNQGSANQNILKKPNLETPTDTLTDHSSPSFDMGSSRLIKTSTGWFVRTREKEDLGPYTSEQEALDALLSYLNLTTPNDKREYSPQIVCGMLIHDPEVCRKNLCALCIEAEASQAHTWKDLNAN